MKYDPDIHHRRSIRLKGYDYSQQGMYFITMNTKNRERMFGTINNDEMIINEYGLIVKEEWFKTAVIRKNIELDSWVIMPDHVHGIIVILETDDHIPTIEQFGKPTSNSIPTIIRGFKSSVTNRINTLRMNKGLSDAPQVWQRNYYEHVIRNEDELLKIREYIINNPLKWNKEEDGQLNGC